MLASGPGTPREAFGEEKPVKGSGTPEGDRERAISYIRELREETMVAAWGAERHPEERRRIVLAAVILGRKLEERLAERGEAPHPDEAQRFLMALMNETIAEFALLEGVGQDAATEFLSDVNNRDLVLEFNEALEAAEATGTPPDDQLRQLVEDRRERAIWSDHWSSG